MKVAILSDVHGNLRALENVLNSNIFSTVDKIILLGDLVDYGPHSNEVVELLSEYEPKIICNIIGNHEEAILKQDYSRFSSERGRKSAQFTRKNLNNNTWQYINEKMNHEGKQEFEIHKKKCLAVHGDITDFFWNAIHPNGNLNGYGHYDYVFSGHSHLPHFFEQYYPVDNLKTRNKKKTVFINPGSVGQPRNLSPHAQFVTWNTDTDEVIMAKIPYDVEAEQSDFSDEIDVFYKERLRVGI